MNVLKNLLRAVNGRVLLLRLLGRLHCALPVAVVCAAVYDAAFGQGLYAWLRGLLFCVPAALSWYAALRLRQLWQFALAGLGIIALSWLLLGHVGGAVLGFLLCYFRLRSRVEEEAYLSFLDRPNPIVFGVFAVAFLFSAVQGLPVLQRLSLLSAALYFMVLLSFRGISRLEGYLVLNRDMARLPTRRIRRVAGAAVGGAVLLAACLLLPAVFGAGGNFRMEVPQYTPHRSAVRSEEEFVPSGGLGELPEWMRDDDEISVVRFPWEAMYAAGVAVLAVAGFFILRLAVNFRIADNRDVIQSTGKEDGDRAVRLRRRRRDRLSLLDRSPNAAIRRRYRERVLRENHAQPRRWQAPAEIEREAGLEDPVLHSLYEKARYGPQPCTAEDVKRLRGRR